MDYARILLMLALILLAAGSVSAVDVEKGTSFSGSSSNVTYIMGNNYTFTQVGISNDTFQIDNFFMRFINNMSNSTFNFTLYQYSTTDLWFNITGYNPGGILDDMQVLLYYENYTYPVQMIYYGFSYGDVSNKSLTTTFYTNLPNNILHITLTPYFTLTFPSDTTGIVVTQDKSKLFNTSQLLELKSELGDGYVKIMYNTVNGTNWTQYYEFYNNQSEALNDSLGLLVKADVLMYFEILDYTNSPIKDSIVRAYQVTPSANWSGYSLFGQRITPDSGITFFIMDSGTQVLLTIQKEGYQLQTVLLTVADQENHASSATAYPIYLQASSTGTYNGISYLIDNSYCPNTSVLHYSLYAPNYATLSYYTSYNPTIHNLVRDRIDRYQGSFINASDYLSSDASFIVYWKYGDDIVLQNTITQSTHCSIPLVNMTAINNVSVSYTNPIYFIGLIVICCLLSIVFKEDGIGFKAFMIGGIFLSLISLQFLWLSIINLLYFVFRAIHGMVKE